MRIRSRRWGGAALGAAALIAAGCSGSSDSIPVQPIAPIVSTATPTASPSPSPTPTLAPLSVSSASLSFIDTGAANAQTVTASEPNYTGTYSETSTNCTNVVTISAPAGGVFTVTPEGSGTCSFTVSDTHGQTKVVNVTVTLTSGVVKGHTRGGAQ